MGELHERLDRWVENDLLSRAQADAIDRYEERSAVAAPAAERGRTDRRSLAAEAIGYVGAALAVGAIALLLSELWDELVVGGRLALVALLTVLLAVGGLSLRRSATPPLQRLTSVLFAGTTLGVAWLTFIVGDDLLGMREDDVALVVGLGTTAVALPLYALRRRALPQLTLLASLLFSAGAAFSRMELPPQALWAGLAFWAAGLAWLLLGTGGWLRPRNVAEISGGIVGLLAIQAASFGESRLLGLVLAVATAGALVALAITSDRVHHLAVGAVGLFVLVPQLAFEVFGDAIGAPATLLIVGLLLVLLAVGLGRARREVLSMAGGVAEGSSRDTDHAMGGEHR